MDFNSLKIKMENAISHHEKELSSIRTSRANISMLDNLYVDAYGTRTPLNQLSNISAPDASTLTVQVWDNSLIKSIENSILDSKLGINPQTDGSIIRLPVPKLSEERRDELSKVASQYAENAKISIRNVRRDGMDELRLEEKEKLISQDDQKKQTLEIQKLTDSYIVKIDEITISKKEEILKV